MFQSKSNVNIIIIYYNTDNNNNNNNNNSKYNNHNNDLKIRKIGNTIISTDHMTHAILCICASLYICSCEMWSNLIKKKYWL